MVVGEVCSIVLFITLKFFYCTTQHCTLTKFYCIGTAIAIAILLQLSGHLTPGFLRYFEGIAFKVLKAIQIIFKALQSILKAFQSISKDF